MVEISAEKRQMIQGYIQTLQPDEDDAEIDVNLDPASSDTTKPKYTVITKKSARTSPHDPYDGVYAVEEIGWKTEDITDEVNKRTPWARRELWARYIVESVAQLHSRGFSIGHLNLNCYLLDDNDRPQLFLPNAAKYRCINADGEVPPEFRKGLRLRDEWVELKPTIQTDLFRLGMILWLLGNSEPVPVSSRFCEHAECDFTP
ncbi:hypothetical protein ABW19_dt0201395 [Dactylella cylindrospora]|nr:hypothetical protein ABW19_dt0201395 [Dactylella cylindrospora]